MHKIHLLILLFSTIAGCMDMQKPELDIQGHRGCRGLFPENSLIGFVQATTMGVTTLEMDVVISGDNQVVVSHEPWMNPQICLTPDRKDLLNQSLDSVKLKTNLYKMSYTEIVRYDCGSMGHPQFPDQEMINAYKPLLSEVVATVDRLTDEMDWEPMHYNIEIKSRPEWDSIFHPDPWLYAELVLNEIYRWGIEGRTTIQSFDVRSLQAVNELADSIQLALLVDEKDDTEVKLSKLGFTPEIISPHHQHCTRSYLEQYQNQSIRVIPWTVNDTLRMDSLIQMGVDGIITDFPDRLVKLVNR